MFDSQMRLLEVWQAIDSREAHRATISLMDFLKDYLEEDELLVEAINLRKSYNHLRELGTSDIPKEKEKLILEEARRIADSVSLKDLKAQDELLKKNYPSRPLIYAADIEKQYSKGRFKLGPISTILNPGEITGIVGENGNGKTTLLRILARLLNFNTGTIQYNFDEIIQSENYLIKNQIAYIPQKLDRWNGTLKQNLHFAASTHGIKGVENERAVEFVIHRMGLSKFSELGWSELSSGYKLRFELAKMLVWSPKVLILDEPLANLDINAQQGMLNDFRHLAKSLKKPLSIILSSQQLFEVEHVADKIIFLSNGKCQYSGSTNEFMVDRNVNIFEISGSFTVAQLKEKFNGKPYNFSENGSSITIHTDRSIASSELLNDFISQGYTIKYFRDISTSTKQLFKL